ncbi:dTMP kinase [Pseudomonas sp. nanlin1]|uniref:dTMP kinase n=1 Tax=Pseudomonas sp. nanlin1 TaxID=3040605 RepID=UPI0038908F78
MNRPLFVAMDGPKGTGKTTLLEALTHALRAQNRKVIRLCERKSDPFRAQTMAMVNELARNPCRELEWAVCERFALSRAWISQQVLPKQPADSIILIDRWYPSEAAFRRTIPFAQILRLNLEQGVRVPDLHVGVVTAPEISWARAMARSRGLSSTLLYHQAEHAAGTSAFEQAVADNGWALCRNDGTLEEGVRQVMATLVRLF